ncbi:MAG: hypothetical protein J5695_05600 [Bacteroidales bacterium]|nr:hypothetical protein [Bacteroidales bacterium]
MFDDGVRSYLTDEDREEAFAKGVAEGQAKTTRENAKKFKDLGVEPEIICQATGLTAEEVAAL